MNEKRRQQLLIELNGIFPTKGDARLVNSLMVMLSSAESLESFGRVMNEAFRANRWQRDPTNKGPWKLHILRDMMDSLAWLNRLSATFVDAIQELHAHYMRTSARVEAETFGEVNQGGAIRMDDRLRRKDLLGEAEKAAPAE